MVFLIVSNGSETTLPIAICHVRYQTVCIVKEPSDSTEHVVSSSHFEHFHMF